jgi:hypothetical protein
LHALSIALALLLISPTAVAVQVSPAREVGVTGRVLAPDGSTIAHGTVMLMTSATNHVSATIDRTGQFRIVPDSSGWQRLFISVPGLAPHRLHVTVPPSRIIALPDITLNPATYFRARFVTTEGEPLGAAGLRRRSFDGDGATMPDPLDHAREQIDPDGTITIGPLAPGRWLLAFDRAPLAQTRLRDVDVTGTRPIIDGGVITIDPGTVLHVDVVDGEGKPVPRHQVWLEDAIQPSPLSFPPLRTDEQGHVVFDRLASGRYRVWTRTPERCGNQELAVSRLVSASGRGEALTKLVVGGRARIRITSPLGPVAGRAVVLSPDSPPEPPWQIRFADFATRPGRTMMPTPSRAACRAATDAAGRVTMAPFPPGPSQLRVVLFNSTYITRVNVPEGDREMAIAVPDGLVPVRAIDQISRQPVGGAQVAWVGGGGRVEAMATPNGDALLEAVGMTGGTLTISARGYQPLEGGFDDTPGTMQEVALAPVAASRLTMRVVDRDGAAIAGAVVGLLARDPRNATEFVAADVKGIASFADVPPGNLQFTAHAKGFAPAALRVAEDRRVSIILTLTPTP